MHHTESLHEINEDLTPEVMSRVDEVMERYSNKAGALIPVLTQCQKIVGYVPVELQEYIAKGLNIPGSTVYGVVTFYSFFSMVPKGRHTIKVCMGTACYVRGAPLLVDEIQRRMGLEPGVTSNDGKYTLETVGCVGACAMAPCVSVIPSH